MPEPALYRVAAVQMDPRSTARSPHNRDNHSCSRLKEAARQGAKLVVFPECALTGYGFASKDEARPLAEPIGGCPRLEAISKACQAARRLVDLRISRIR